jgi:hypothetical protein
MTDKANIKNWQHGFPPKNRLVAMVVRKWVAEHPSSIRASFIAHDPSRHLKAMGKGFGDLPFEPSQTVLYGRLVEQDGELVVLGEEGEEAGVDAAAILAWIDVPSFALDQAAARQADMLIGRVMEKQVRYE